MRLTHWGWVAHICVSDLTSIDSDNGLSPGRRQAIIRTNAGLLLIEPLGTNFSEILIEILIFSIKKMRLKVSSAKRPPFCLGLNVLISSQLNECWKGFSKHVINKSNVGEEIAMNGPPKYVCKKLLNIWYKQWIFECQSNFQCDLHIPSLQKYQIETQVKMETALL